jgi:hypothetical protein
VKVIAHHIDASGAGQARTGVNRVGALPRHRLDRRPFGTKARCWQPRCAATADRPGLVLEHVRRQQKVIRRKDNSRTAGAGKA